MTEAVAAIGHRGHDKVSSATRRFASRCAIGALALVLGALPATGVAAPAISRADDTCAPGWIWKAFCCPRCSHYTG